MRQRAPPGRAAPASSTHEDVMHDLDGDAAARAVGGDCDGREEGLGGREAREWSRLGFSPKGRAAAA